MGGKKTIEKTHASIGILGGTGLYEIDGIEDIREVRIRTPFGSPSDPFIIGTLAGRRGGLLAPPRPGPPGSSPPGHYRGHTI